jgi:EAL domain-containing protein (putative c-di-GMP-specific phosphodiesterase class I)/ActR/RegA family two-component response regulator
MTSSHIPESQLVLLLDDDVMVTEALAAGLERHGRTVVTCNDLESAQLMVDRLRPSHVVTDVRLSGAFGFEGLEFVRYVAERSPESRVLVMTGDAPEALQLEASQRGAVAFLQKPFDVSELDATLDLLTCSALAPSAAETRVIRMPLLDEILGSESLQIAFQPIVQLDQSWTVAGFEAQAQYRDHPLLRNPEVLFQYATRKGRVDDLELTCIAKAVRAAALLPNLDLLFLNVHPAVLSEKPAFPALLLAEGQRHCIPGDRIVVEITEQGPLTAGRILFESVEALRRVGVRFAFDDVGVAYSHLPLIDRIRPSFLKISQHFGTAFERDTTKLKIVMNLQSLARDFQCDLIVEGIEDLATAEMALRLGIKYGQGLLFGRHATN